MSGSKLTDWYLKLMWDFISLIRISKDLHIRNCKAAIHQLMIEKFFSDDISDYTHMLQRKRNV